MSRRGFTLIELLVSITIIGILAALVVGAMWRADVSAKRVNTKTTIGKIAPHISEIWESYGPTKKMPIDAGQVLKSNGNAPYSVQYGNAMLWLQYFIALRAPTFSAAGYTDPLTLPTSSPAFPNNLQMAAVRLGAKRELMRLELPCRFSDFTSSPVGTTPASVLPVRTLLIPQPMAGINPAANPGGLSEQYRQFFIANATTYNDSYQPAECLYMILKFSSQNDMGQKNLVDDPRLVGDVDGDGMPEIQDHFNSGEFTPPAAGSAFTQHNKPISFVRWPAGFFSDLQRGPVPGQTQDEYAAMFHDINDPMRIDHRAFNLIPLVYSGGPDTNYEIWELSDPTQVPASAQAWIPFIVNDPYYSAANYPLPGSQMNVGTNWPGGLVGTGGFNDNITNHEQITGR